MKDAHTVHSRKGCASCVVLTCAHSSPSCCASPGKEPPPVPERILSGLSYLSSDDEEEGEAVAAQQAQAKPSMSMPNPMALLTAWMAASQAQNIRKAVSNLQEGQGQGQGQGPKQ